MIQAEPIRAFAADDPAPEVGEISADEQPGFRTDRRGDVNIHLEISAPEEPGKYLDGRHEETAPVGVLPEPASQYRSVKEQTFHAETFPLQNSNVRLIPSSNGTSGFQPNSEEKRACEANKTGFSGFR